MRIYDSIYQAQGESADQHALFRLTGHFRDLSPTALQAGFHRGNHSIFMDIFRIRPSDWPLIFTHELLHSLDSYALVALPIYQNEFTKLKLDEWAARGGSPDRAPDDIEDLLWPWLGAGLDLGLRSEYRAWVVTAWIYFDETRRCSWMRSSWFEEIFQHAQPTGGDAIKKIVFNYLDQHSPDRTDDIFARPAIRAALTTLRNELREESDNPAELGDLEHVNPGDDFPPHGGKQRCQR
jgi:hypothetical protein